MVKQIANFWGISTMTGKNMVNAMKTKNTPAPRSSPKYMRDFPEGTLLVAEWKLPDKSFAPLENLKDQDKSEVKNTNSGCRITREWKTQVIRQP